MTAARINENNFAAALSIGSWLLLALMVCFGFFLGSPGFAIGTAAGGVLAILNNNWLHNDLRRLLSQKPAKPGRFIQFRFMARLALTAAILYLLIVYGRINILGLLVGLSVLVIVITALSIFMLTSKGE